MTAKGGGQCGSRGNRAQGTWYQYTVDLSDFAGQTGYIAIRHFNCTDQFALAVDDFSYDAGVIPSSIALMGLNTATTYEVQVQGICPYGLTEWSESITFTTASSVVTQMIELSAGWNWISLYIEVEDPIEALQMLETALGDNATVISGSEVFTEYYGDGFWIGDLDDEGLTNEQMYMVEVVNDCEIQLEGMPANPAYHEIAIYPGWNWIGFPCGQELSLEEGLTGFEAEEGDQLTEAELYTEYSFGMWIGDVATLLPGQGYMYFSNSTEPKTLIFSTTAKGKSVFLQKRKE